MFDRPIPNLAAEQTPASNPDGRLGVRYLLVVPVPFYRDAEGAVWLDPLWRQDLMAHLAYLSDLTVLAPCERLTAREGLEKVPATPGLTFSDLPAPKGALAALVSLPGALRAAWRAVRKADVVHSGVAGWPMPPGFLVNPIAVLLGKPLVVVFESAFWRVRGPGAGFKARLRAGLTEAFARWSARRARLAIFTHAQYRDSLAAGSRARMLIAPASWIDENDILPQPAARASWQAKPRAPQFLFAARLIAEKGVEDLIDALRILDAQGAQVRVDIIGEGGLRDTCEQAAATFRNVRARVLQPVPYGAPFFALLRGYHAVLVPARSDEQPRVIFDAFSQAVPVIATDTPGNAQIVSDGVNGHLVRASDVQELAEAIGTALCSDLERLGLAALAAARSSTHREMHARRAEVLRKLFADAGP